MRVHGPVGTVGPQGEPGRDGTDGARGPQGEKGIDGSAGRDGDRGPEGLPGAPGRDGRDGMPGVPGAAGEKGLDGTDGRDGKDGLDALGFDDIKVEHDGERGFSFKFVRGDREKTFGAFTVPSMIHRGVFEQGKTYERGDCVTWGGHCWHAKATTSQKPDFTPASAQVWSLAVKAGRDCKEGKAGNDGAPGKDGKDGKLRS